MNKEKYIKELESTIITRNPIKLIKFAKKYNPDAVSYTHLTLPTTPYV